MEKGADIFFDKRWQQIYADHQGMQLNSVSFTCKYGTAEYAFCERPVEINGEKFPYIDIVSPCAFSGPYLIPADESNECKIELAEAFDHYFQGYCDEHGIVAEYIQFNPWIKNHEPFSDIYKIDFRFRMVALDLSKEDLMMDELNGRRRRSVRNAVKQGVEVFYDDSDAMLDEFMRLYKFAIQKHNMTNYYRFDRAFIKRMFDELRGKICFAYAMHQNKCISICILTYENKDYVHYHLAANDPAESKANGSSLLIYDIAKKAQENGYKWFDLGGAVGQLLEFKESFTKNGFSDYYCGKKIRNQEIYNMLTEKKGVKATEYFPAYRYDESVD